jgi:hypothetical protein
MTLLVRITGRDGDHELSVPPELTPHEELTRFLNRQGPYALVWIQLDSGEYVRYDQVVSIRVQEEQEDAAASARRVG